MAGRSEKTFGVCPQIMLKMIESAFLKKESKEMYVEVITYIKVKRITLEGKTTKTNCTIRYEINKKCWFERRGQSKTSDFAQRASAAL